MDIGACTNAQVDITQLHNCTFQLQSYKGGCIPHKICIEIAHANIHRGYDEVISAISIVLVLLCEICEILNLICDQFVQLAGLVAQISRTCNPSRRPGLNVL